MQLNNLHTFAGGPPSIEWQSCAASVSFHSFLVMHQPMIQTSTPRPTLPQRLQQHLSPFNSV